MQLLLAQSLKLQSRCCKSRVGWTRFGRGKSSADLGDFRFEVCGNFRCNKANNTDHVKHHPGLFIVSDWQDELVLGRRKQER